MERWLWSGIGPGLAATLLVGAIASAQQRASPLIGASAFVRAAPPRAPAHAERFDLIVAATTDVHGRLRGWDYYANAPDSAHSLAGAATIVDSIRRAHPGRVVLVDAGDLLQGNPLLFVAAKIAPPPVHPVIAAMNVMRYDAAVVGNHEFNYGVPLLKRALAQAAFPFLAANVREANGVPFVAPYTIVVRSGVHIGIVGATTPGSMVWDRDNLHAAHLTVSDIVPAVRAAVAAARRRQADVIVVLLHAGLNEVSTYDTLATGLPSENVAARVAKEIDGIDLVVFGHSHKFLVDSTINGALLVQPRNWAASVSVASLTVERVKRSWKVVAHRGQAIAVAGHQEDPAVVAASAGTHRATVAWVNAPIGRTAVRWRADSARVADMPITDLVNEVMRREAGADLSVTAAFSLEASLDTGQITIANVSKLYPYDNTLRAIRISGTQLRAFLEHSVRYYRSLTADGHIPDGGIIDPAVPGFNFDILSGAEYAIDLTRPVGSRITRLAFSGHAIAPTDSFTLALNNYRHSGGGGYGMLAGSPVVYQKDVDIRQLVIDEVRRVGVIAPALYATSNWVLTPASAVAAAFAAQSRSRASESGGSAPTPVAAAQPASSITTAGARTVRVIAMSDFHAALLPRPNADGRMMGGAVALSAAIVRAERECSGACQSVVVDAGDVFTGSPASDWDAGRPTVAVLRRLHIVAGALGNHEFDFGQDTLRQRLAELNYRVLGANVRGPDGRMPAWVSADTMIVRGALRIGIVGAAATHTRSMTKLRNVNDLQFLDPAPLLSERVRALRTAGANVVLSVVHEGARCDRQTPAVCRGPGLDIASRLTERPDVFIAGHAHENLNTRVAGMPVIEAASSGRSIVVVDIPLDGGAVRTNVRDVWADMTDGADPVVDSIVRTAYAHVRARLEQRVATMAAAMTRSGPQHALGNLIADAARLAGASDFAAWNSDGMRADLRAGATTYGDVHEVTPFGNVLVRVRLTGRQLAQVLERWVERPLATVHVSGLRVDVDTTRPPGQRIVRLATGRATGGAGGSDRVLSPTHVYTLTVNDFMLDDDEGKTMNRALSRQFLPVRDIDMLADYLRRLPQPVRGSAAQRVRIVSPVPQH